MLRCGYMTDNWSRFQINYMTGSEIFYEIKHRKKNIVTGDPQALLLTAAPPKPA